MALTSSTEPEPNITQNHIQAKYQEIKHELDKDGIVAQLATAFEALLAQSKVDHISKCLCTSLGSLTSEKYVKIDGQPNRPMYQLAAFEIMKASLGMLLPILTIYHQAFS